MRFTTHLFVCLVVAAAGCSSTREIETSRPRAPSTPAGEDRSAPRQARLTILLEPGETSLPEEVHHLRFRISEIQVLSAGGNWIRLSSDMQAVELSAARRGPRRTVLDTRVDPTAYDSVALSFDQVFAQFDANSGAPLTIADDEPLRFALHMHPLLESPTVMQLRFEPGASLRRAPDCRWFFVPVVVAEVQP